MSSSTTAPIKPSRASAISSLHILIFYRWIIRITITLISVSDIRPIKLPAMIGTFTRSLSIHLHLQKVYKLSLPLKENIRAFASQTLVNKCLMHSLTRYDVIWSQPPVLRDTFYFADQPFQSCSSIFISNWNLMHNFNWCSLWWPHNTRHTADTLCVLDILRCTFPRLRRIRVCEQTKYSPFLKSMHLHVLTLTLSIKCHVYAIQ